MKITLNRSEFHLFERLTSKLVRSNQLPFAVGFFPVEDGLAVSAHCSGAVLTLCFPDTTNVEPFTIPWPIIKQIAKKWEGIVEIDISDDTVNVRWDEYGIPQRKSFNKEEPRDPCILPVPERFEVDALQLYDGIVAAFPYTDPDAQRYALGGVALNGSNSTIAATDGRQMMIQSGYTFPWKENVVCPASKIFTSKELRSLGDTVSIGLVDGWLCFQVGHVTFQLREADGKFPNVESIWVDNEGEQWVNLNPADVKFVLKRLGDMPGKEEGSSPVVLVFDDHVSIRGYDTEQNARTDLRLTNSSYNGPPLQDTLNREYLKQALALGIDMISLSPNHSPIRAQSESKRVMIMPLKVEKPPVCDPNKITILESEAANSVLSRVVGSAVSSVIRKTASILTGTKTKKSAQRLEAEIDAKIVQSRSLLGEVLSCLGELIGLQKLFKKRESELNKREKALDKWQAQIDRKSQGILPGRPNVKKPERKEPLCVESEVNAKIARSGSVFRQALNCLTGLQKLFQKREKERDTEQEQTEDNAKTIVAGNPDAPKQDRPKRKSKVVASSKP